MICPKCKTRNAIGFKHCHECGGPLAQPTGELATEEAILAEAERRGQHAAALLAGALELQEQRQYSEAIPLAEEASEILPDSSTAFALLASLYERTGDHDKAILAMERVAALNPDSNADRLRLEKMKQGQIVIEEPKRRVSLTPLLPIGAAAAVAALVLALGYPVVNRMIGGKPATNAGIVETSGQDANPAGPIGSPGNPGYAAVTSPTEARPDPFAPLVQQAYGQTATPAPDRATPDRVPPRPAAPHERERDNSSGIVVTCRVPPAAVPAPPGDNNGNGDPSNPGALPSLNGGNGTNTDNAAGNGFGSGGRLRVGPPNGGDNANGNPGNGQDSPNSYIHIQVRPQNNQNSGQGGGNAGGDQAPPTANNEDGGARSGESALARGRRLYRAGKYRESISAYQEAGGGEAQQGVAEAHRRLGENDAARSAYREAIRIYDAQGNSSGAQTCRAALEVLGG